MYISERERGREGGRDSERDTETETDITEVIHEKSRRPLIIDVSVQERAQRKGRCLEDSFWTM